VKGGKEEKIRNTKLEYVTFSLTLHLTKSYNNLCCAEVAQSVEQ
jgi:hypothetical protein